ncbi:MAG: aspartate/tyrosine/aromatic aminotransferase [Cellvibrionales bacterium]|nr:aspartate/tyrosine/aromatic aminotransferase [Cellvibrionales bacterium]
MFERLRPQPTDPIIELFLRAQADPAPHKVDLSAGVYKDEQGATPILQAVRRAEPRRLQNEDSRSYQGILGDARFTAAVARLILGERHGMDERLTCLHTVAGSAALFLGGRLLHAAQEKPLLWVGKPTWANHRPLFGSAGVTLAEYPYYDSAACRLLFSEMMDALAGLPPQSVVLLHGGCHNPSGADLSHTQWVELADLFARKSLVPFIDVAYQGFGEGLEADTFGWRRLAESVPELLLAYSCSKNFALYRDRVGALLVISKNKKAAACTRSNMMALSRATYSMPAAHGAFLVAEILNNAELRPLWEREVAAMRERINGMRRAFVTATRERGMGDRFDFVAAQRGMFSFLGLSAKQVQTLRDQHSVYMLDSSRISIAGLTAANLPHVADSLRAVL